MAGALGGPVTGLHWNRKSPRCGLRLEVQSTKVPAYNCGGLCQDLVNNCQHWREPTRIRWGNPDNGRVQVGFLPFYILWLGNYVDHYQSIATTC